MKNVLLNDFSLTIPEGRIALMETYRWTQPDFLELSLDLSTDFNSFVVDDWINKLKSQNSKGIRIKS